MHFLQKQSIGKAYFQETIEIFLSTMRTAFLLLLTASTIVNAAHLKGYLTTEDIPSSSKDWYTLENGVEFQPSDDTDVRLEHARKLWINSKKQDDPIFLDGSETYYDANAQAWRLLGFYIDCNQCQNGSNEAACIQAGQQTTCQRFLLWAAYVDLEYSGGGLSEYIQYDRANKTWNGDACKASGSKRCVKMDCHATGTHWSLLGVFKEPDYNTFMQQLFGFQGDCTWTQSEFATMSSAMNYMPNGCTQASNGLYYDIKPATGGSATIGIYNDKYCMKEHNGSKASAKETLASLGGDGSDSWNAAFDAFKYCHPCRVSDSASTAQSSGNGDKRNCQANQGLNQCEQFSGTTNMYPANYHDVMVAEEQGTLSYLNVGRVRVGVTKKEQDNKWKKTLLSVLMMIGSFFLFVWALVRCAKETDSSAGLKQPLMNDGATTTRRRSFRRSNSGSSRTSQK